MAKISREDVSVTEILSHSSVEALQILDRESIVLGRHKKNWMARGSRHDLGSELDEKDIEDETVRRCQDEVRIGATDGMPSDITSPPRSR
jgi:hypothetical protein